MEQDLLPENFCVLAFSVMRLPSITSHWTAYRIHNLTSLMLMQLIFIELMYASMNMVDMDWEKVLLFLARCAITEAVVNCLLHAERNVLSRLAKHFSAHR